MKANILTLAITLTVGIILAGSLLMPVISDATTTEKTFENKGYFYMDKIAASDADAYTIEWSSATAGVIAVNGVDVNVSDWSPTSYGQTITIFATESDIFRVGMGSGGNSLLWVQIRGGTISYAQASSSFDATIESGTATIYLDSETSPRTLSYTDAYMIASEKSDYIMKRAADEVYMLKDSPIYSIGVTSIAAGSGTDTVVFGVEGTADDVDISVIRQSTVNEITLTEPVINKTAVSGYVNLYTFKEITFTATELATDTDCVYSYVIVPTTITAELSQHLAPGEIAILNALPILIIVALVVMAAGALYLKRDD